ncbi:hypothetical protein BgiBS90_026229, partial [Biomphalaria glabrata]
LVIFINHTRPRPLNTQSCRPVAHHINLIQSAIFGLFLTLLTSSAYTCIMLRSLVLVFLVAAFGYAAAEWSGFSSSYLDVNIPDCITASVNSIEEFNIMLDKLNLLGIKKFGLEAFKNYWNSPDFLSSLAKLLRITLSELLSYLNLPLLHGLTGNLSGDSALLKSLTSGLQLV